MEENILFLKVKTEKGYSLIKPNEIIYICSDNKNSVIYLEHQKTVITHPGIGEMEKMLDCTLFFRVHRTCIVNMHKIVFIYRGYKSIRLKCGTEFPVSRQRKSEFIKAVDNNFVSLRNPKTIKQ